MNEKNMNTLSRSAVAMKILETIRRDILTGRLTDGTLLTEEALSASFDASRGLIRSVLQQLHKEGMIKMLENGCKQVIGFDLQAAVQLYDLREYIELSAVREIFGKGIRNFASLFEIFNNAQNGNGQLLELDIRFHRALITLADNRFILSVFDNIAPVMNAVFAINISTYEEQFKTDFFTTHNLLIYTLLNGTEQENIDAVKAHIDNARNITIHALEQIKEEMEHH